VIYAVGAIGVVGLVEITYIMKSQGHIKKKPR
jgi:hypothetical protein